MLNIIKAIKRSLRKSLMLITLFSFLLLGSALSFGALYGTFHSMKTTYSDIAVEGKLHDYVIQDEFKIKTKIPYR
jgi:hypothetical protein